MCPTSSSSEEHLPAPPPPQPLSYGRPFGVGSLLLERGRTDAADAAPQAQQVLGRHRLLLALLTDSAAAAAVAVAAVRGLHRVVEVVQQVVHGPASLPESK